MEHAWVFQILSFPKLGACWVHCTQSFLSGNYFWIVDIVHCLTHLPSSREGIRVKLFLSRGSAPHQLAPASPPPPVSGQGWPGAWPGELGLMALLTGQCSATGQGRCRAQWWRTLPPLLLLLAEHSGVEHYLPRAARCTAAARCLLHCCCQVLLQEAVLRELCYF